MTAVQDHAQAHTCIREAPDEHRQFDVSQILSTAIVNVRRHERFINTVGALLFGDDRRCTAAVPGVVYKHPVARTAGGDKLFEGSDHVPIGWPLLGGLGRLLLA
jgi:hypothetical protein